MKKKPPEADGNFFEKLQRTIKTAPGVEEPRVWFKEVRYLDELKPGEPRSKITLHRGLNILWAEPESPEAEQGLYRDGLAGHSSGKTLFCRTLRHLLGEKTFATKAQRDRIHGKLLSLWAVALVRVDKESWVVGRPLATAGADFAIRAETIDEVLEAGAATGGFEAYLEKVRALGNCVEPLYPDNGWRNLLPWVARDQEARFSNVANWRESVSEGDSPNTKVSDRHQIMRAVLHLLDLKEPRLRMDLEKAQSDFEKGQLTHECLENELNGRKALMRERVLALFPQQPPESRDELVERLDSMKALFLECKAKLDATPEPESVILARNHHAEDSRKLWEIETELTNIPGRITEKKTLRDERLALVRDLRTGNAEDPAREAKGWCPHTLHTAIANKCVHQPAVSPASAHNLERLEHEAEQWATEIARMESRRKELPSLVAEQKKVLSISASALNTALRNANERAISIGEKIGAAHGVDAIVKDVGLAETALGKQAVANTAFASTIERTKRDIADLRDEVDTSLASFSYDFADVIHAVMGPTVDARISLTGDGLGLHASRNSVELTGAALDTIKILAFDLASIVSSLEGRGEHPRFLIHDGPREGDMSRVIYDRFFFYAAQLESSFPTPDDAPFQYLLTTTTPPPESMQMGSRWLLLPVLNSRDKETRLLKEDF